MSLNPSRRDLARLAAIGAIGASAVPNAAASPATDNHALAYKFPPSFVWAVATAAYQIEGAAQEDGRKPSTWDTYSHTPGRVTQGHTGDVANDHYHRFPEDIKMIQWLGVKAYRLSISWSRVFPDGSGAPNEKGIAFYEKLIDALLAAGITPYVTLFHWDLPQALEDRVGGWTSKETSKAFADYAAYVSKRLSDRVKHFFTTNEFSCFIDEAYGSGTKAPGKQLGDKLRNQARHNAVYGHGLAALALRAAARGKLEVGIAENSNICVPAIETPAYIAATRKAMRIVNAQYLTAIMEGSYADEYLKAEGANAPRFTAEEMKAIGTPLDFIGLNCYTPTWIRPADNPNGFAVIPNPTSYPKMASPWLTIGPQILYWAPRHMADIWKVKQVFITENGCSSDDVIAEDGQIYDTDRVMYVRNHLMQAQRAVAEGYPLAGYFWWSLMDNFEWNDGYTKRFGVYYVDFETQKRTPKLSAYFYKETIKRGAVA